MPIVKVNSLDRVKNVLAKVHVPVVLIFAILFCSGVAVAQMTPSPPPTPTPPLDRVDGNSKNQDNSPLTTFEEELRAKRAIKIAEKEHEDNLKRAREIAQIGKELNDSLKDKSILDRDSLKKVERLEKLTKKVRGEAGGEDEEVEIPKRPADLPATVAQIAEASDSLSKNVIDTPRQVVSASVIGKANVLLELIKMVRNFARP
ncbi:MAG TPA: hypothetical protein VJ306_05375 [Pyrinomonadaceae bacterium]|nr:hypothetical protein [Pyrinomonadaceae bacterium]